MAKNVNRSEGPKERKTSSRPLVQENDILSAEDIKDALRDLFSDTICY